LTKTAVGQAAYRGCNFLGEKLFAVMPAAVATAAVVRVASSLLLAGMRIELVRNYRFRFSVHQA
jgi:hypothetical protein